MFSRLLWGFAVLGCLFGTGFVAGFQTSSTQCELDKQRFQNDALEKQTEAMRKAQDVENTFKDAIINGQNNLADDLKLVDENFSSAHNSFASSINVDGMFNDATSPDSASTMSADPSASKPVQASPCKCDTKNTAKLQRLYEQQLEVARDCDITTAYYNRVLELWDTIKTASK